MCTPFVQSSLIMPSGLFRFTVTSGTTTYLGLRIGYVLFVLVTQYNERKERTNEITDRPTDRPSNQPTNPFLKN